MHNRRDVLKKMVAGSLAVGAASLSFHKALAKNLDLTLKGNINYSVCRWTYSHLALEDLCLLVNELGFNAIDLVGPAEWPVLKKFGIECSMCNGAEISLEDGWNEKKNHQQLIESYRDMISLVAGAGYRNLICFSGNRRGMDDERGLKNSIEGLRKIMPLAEKAGVIIQLELFNSKVDHPDYMADNSAWGIELCKRLGSPNFKLLYDIYHMQISEGDIIRTIKDNHQYFGHYHTAGVPGRNEIGDTQELNYPAIMRAIAETGYHGFVAQEFIPIRENKNASLKEAIKICDV